MTLLDCICLIILGLASCSSQVLTSTRPQPWPLQSDSMLSCCKFIGDAVSLAKCSSESKSMKRIPSSVALVSFLSEGSGHFGIPDILKFGSYMLANTAVYAEHNNYSFHWMSSETGSNYQPDDLRWNKVNIFNDALNQQNGWARNVEFMVWLDADAIVLDLGLRIEKVAAQHPEADIIASADIRQGFLNSGFLILRNTPWVRNFNKKWWTIADRHEKCDQDAFDMLYREYLNDFKSHKPDPNGLIGDIQKKIAILSMDGINSHPPAMTYQKDYNQVLHLMGEITPQRERLFKTAFQNICLSAKTQKRPPQQLGLTREAILNSASIVYEAQVLDLIDKASEEDSKVDSFDALSRASHHMLDIYRDMNTSESLAAGQKLVKDIFELTIRRLKDFDKKLQARDPYTVELQTKHMMFAYFLKRAAENGNDLYHALNDPDQKFAIGSKVLKILADLRKNVASSSYSLADHMSALTYVQMGQLKYQIFTERKKMQNANEKFDTSYLQQAIDWATKAVGLFEMHFEESDNSSINREYVDALDLMGLLSCSTENFDEARKMYSRAIKKASDNAHGIMMGVNYEKLGATYFNAAFCDVNAKRYDIAFERLGKFLEIVERLGFDHANPSSQIVYATQLMREIGEKGLNRISQSELNEDDMEEYLPVKALEKPKFAKVKPQKQLKPTPLEPKSSQKTQASSEKKRVIEIEDEEEDDEAQSDGEEEEWVECNEGEEGCEEVEVEILSSEAERVLSKIISVDDLDEWEICEEGTPGCEEVEIVFNHDEWEECEEGEEGCEEVEVDIRIELTEEEQELLEIREQYTKQSSRFTIGKNAPPSLGSGHGDGSDSVVRGRVANEVDYEEWEDCEEGEEGCEEVEVGDDEDEDEETKELREVRAQYAKQSKRFNLGQKDAASKSSFVDDESLEDMDKEELEELQELAEIRAQYAKQSQKELGKA